MAQGLPIPGLHGEELPLTGDEFMLFTLPSMPDAAFRAVLEEAEFQRKEFLRKQGQLGKQRQAWAALGRQWTGGSQGWAMGWDPPGALGVP